MDSASKLAQGRPELWAGSVVAVFSASRVGERAGPGESIVDLPPSKRWEHIDEVAIVQRLGSVDGIFFVDEKAAAA